MSKIKIICNPYKKENLFQVFNEEEQWVNINYENNPNSKLLSDSFHKGFFPFMADKIVREIINEYGVAGEKIELHFEGTNDDFKELQEVCTISEDFQDVSLIRESNYINDADKVLNEIIQVFKELKPIITESESNKEAVENNLDKFLDITNDVVPLCIMGNYSAGKSTFINALIGNEILPSGDEPVTAKVFKINQAEQDGVAYIKLQRDTECMIMFYEQGYEFVGAERIEPLVEEISNELDKISGESITKRMNKTLSIINQYNDDTMSNLIEITISFNGGLWEQTNTRFVILDTPGSNSASNKDHSEVLEKALEGLTNGLAIYVSEYDTLDSMDNKHLYDKIKEMKELDSRFTLIVVNKADENDLPVEGYYSREKADEILNYTVPKNLYTEGIFFVSSILGLGSKTEGKFISKHLNRVYRKTKFLFDDIEDEDYTVLYRYNIMPEQLKARTIRNSENAKEDLVYINSGLYSVEQEIQNFANRYASYNKCKQSTIYLDNIMDIISKEIQEIIVHREKVRKDLKDALEKDKMDLVNQIQITSEKESEQYIQIYTEWMDNFAGEITPSFKYENIKTLENQFTEEQKELLDFNDKDEDVKESLNLLKINLKEGMNDIFKNRNLNSLRNVGKNFIGDVKDTFDDLGELQSTKKEANRETANLLLDKVKEDYLHLSSNAQIKIDAASKEYWTKRSEQIKKEFSQIITGSTALSDDKRTEISEIIMTYRDIQFDQSKHIAFELEDFVQGIKFGNIVLYESDKLNIRKVVNSYNKLFDLFTTEVKNTLRQSHSKTFEYWLEHLLSIIVKNIVNYSPVLSEKQKDIEEETQKIHDLEGKQEKIKGGKWYIDRMMNWQTDEQ